MDSWATLVPENQFVEFGKHNGISRKSAFHLKVGLQKKATLTDEPSILNNVVKTKFKETILSG